MLCFRPFLLSSCRCGSCLRAQFPILSTQPLDFSSQLGVHILDPFPPLALSPRLVTAAPATSTAAPSCRQHVHLRSIE